MVKMMETLRRMTGAKEMKGGGDSEIEKVGVEFDQGEILDEDLIVDGITCMQIAEYFLRTRELSGGAVKRMQVEVFGLEVTRLAGRLLAQKIKRKLPRDVH